MPRQITLTLTLQTFTKVVFTTGKKNTFTLFCQFLNHALGLGRSN